MGPAARPAAAQETVGSVKQHEIWWAELPPPIGRRPVLLLSRDQAYRLLKHVTVAEVSTTIRNIGQCDSPCWLRVGG